MSTPQVPQNPGEETTDLSKRYDIPLGLAHTTMQALKDRIKVHYDLASDYYLKLWGEHIHHGYWPTAASKATESKETAQLNLIHLLLTTAAVTNEAVQVEAASHATTATAADTGTAVPIAVTNDTHVASTERTPQHPLRILDVGCGVGGTTRYLAKVLGAQVTGITISGKQVQIAQRLSRAAAITKSGGNVPSNDEGAVPNRADGATETDAEFITIGEKGGQVKFVELDAEKMSEYFAAEAGDAQGFDVVWISEALSHFPNKALFFQNAHRLLRPGGKLVLADWFKAEELGEGVFEADIKPIEDGMLLPPLCTQQDYVNLATTAGLQVLGGPKDISLDVSKTWDISWSLIQNPSLWAFAFSQGRDGIAFLQAFRAMRRGYANGSFRYAVMAFSKNA
ncbi:S-adenosyl-L-methionine-dependent methyltransferase [Chaetomium sp. MPI-SDFR-AT-0129]|nr:S-adenosyl-L-methionine-dependent methyltransferase [Chaetomium sp. MPI-SDFR-AT-0129]